MGNASKVTPVNLLVSVHPHVHGERIGAITGTVRGFGSSPRTWGTLWSELAGLKLGRFIPTYMGNATGWRTAWTRITVHPHVHGERMMISPTGRRSGGSSPRTWGTHYATIGVLQYYRFIPTYMGNANVCSPGKFWFSVHPHVHGERTGNDRATRKTPGSSPRTWGTLAVQFT